MIGNPSVYKRSMYLCIVLCAEALTAADMDIGPRHDSQRESVFAETKLFRGTS